MTDNGIGIEPAVIKGLFEMFSQIDSAIDRAEGGLGIGLALVKGLVALHGGTRAGRRVRDWGRAVSSRSGCRALWSSSGARAGVHKPPSPVALAGPRGKVVIADDNRDAADSLKLLLELSGYDTFVAYNGQEALDFGARERPEAFILDVGMPDMTGYEVARRIRQQAWGRSALLRRGDRLGAGR